MLNIRKIFSTVIRKLLPMRFYRLVTNGFIIIPKYYSRIIEESEKNMTYTLGNSNEKTLMLARKYAHIIDKGLQREDTQPGHSSEYYKICIESIKKLDQSSHCNDPTLSWIKEKVNLYEHLQENGIVPENKDIIDSIPTAIDYDSLFSLIKSRRSNRQFSQKTISNDIMIKLLEPVNWAASSCNKQPITVYHTNNPQLNKQCLACCAGGTGFSEFIPGFLVFTADVSAYVWPSEIMLPYIDTSLGAQNVFLAATTLGITGTILSWAQKTENQEKTLRKLLNIPATHQIIFCAVIGYASFNSPIPTRKTLS